MSLWISRRERSEASCQACGCKSRRCKSPCGTVAISGSLWGDPATGSPDVKAPGGQAGIEPPRSGQSRGQTSRRAVAKANGRTAEIGSRTKLIQAEGRSAKTFFPLVNGQRRCGRHGEMHRTPGGS